VSPKTNRTSPTVSSLNLAALEVAQSSPVMIDVGFVLMWSHQRLMDVLESKMCGEDYLKLVVHD
jgi:hypothetical protein